VVTQYHSLTERPFFMQVRSGSGTTAIAYTAAEFRDYTAAINRRTGVLGSSDFIVTQTDNVGFSVRINSGFIRVGGAGDNYLVRLAADIPSVPLTGFITDPPIARVHGVYVAVYDGVKYTDSDEYRAQIVITEDVGNGTPIPPGDVAAYSRIATITINPNAPFIENKDIDNSKRRHGGSSGEYIELGGSLLDQNEYADASSDTHTASYRAIYSDGTVRLGGSLKRKDGKVFAGDAEHKIGYTHPNLRPTATRHLVCPCSINKPHTDGKTGTYTCRLTITSDGAMSIYMPGGNSPEFIFFDGVTYDLDGDSI